MSTEPNGCRWCGIGEREHASRFSDSVGQHRYAAPSSMRRLERMITRRAAQPAPHNEPAASAAWKEDSNG